LLGEEPGGHARVQRDAQAYRVRKEYLAVVRGTPRPLVGAIRLPLRRDPNDRRRVIVDRSGAPSETRYQVVERGTAHSIVRCELVTGRTHQIRVHLAHSGWPIAGDRQYGASDPLIQRQALHASSITLQHPDSRKQLRIEAPMPSDFQHALSYAVQFVSADLR